jgi:hypothetical protein
MRQAWWSVALVALGSGSALADYPAVTDRNFAIDLYQGPVIGSPRILGMGGATVAVAEGSATVPYNAAAAAVRVATSHGNFDWDFHVDWLIPVTGDDLSNSGLASKDDSQFLLELGGLIQVGKWGLALSVGADQHTFASSNVSRVSGDLSVARSFGDGAWNAGLGLRAYQFAVAAKNSSDHVFEIDKTAVTGGLVYAPLGKSLRLGLSGVVPLPGDNVANSSCDPLNCMGYILPNNVTAPWQVTSGVAWRLAGTPWNERVATQWRDERALLLAADVLVTGAVSGGDGVEAFLRQQLQPSGRQVNVSVRAGVEAEPAAGVLRLRAGTYWEPSRYSDRSGRMHGTGGAEVALFPFHMFGNTYRLRLAGAVDVAPAYHNVALSVGFWH